MKSFYTSLFYAKALALSLFFAAPIVASGQVLFTQNFNSVSGSGTAAETAAFATFQTAIGEDHKFDHLAFSGTSTIRVLNATYPNQLRFFRGDANIACARTTDLVATPDFLKIKFKVQVGNYANATNAANTAISFFVGSGFSADNVAPTTNIHSRFGIGLFTNGTTYSNGTYVVRNLTSFLNSSDYTTQQEITWYINHSGSSQSYTNPAGGTSTVANDKSDVWIGTTNPSNLDEMNAPTSTALTDFKFVVSLPSATVVLDDIEVSGAMGVVLPVSLTSFTAQKAGTTNQLTWKTATETNSKGFDVQRQTASGTWETLGFVKGIGKAATYTFEDKTPLSISYYRLRQVDFDGTETLSKVVSASQTQKGKISIAPNPTSDKVNIQLNQDGVSNQEATIVLFDMTGRQILTQKTTTDVVELDLSNLAKGMYVMTVQSNNAIFQEKIIRQ